MLVGMNECDRLIEEMDNWIKELQPLKSFILPMGSAPVAFLHVARTVARGQRGGLSFEKRRGRWFS